MNVGKVRKLNLCVSCEVCNAACPVDAIEMEYESGQFLPRIDKNKCIDCELCLKVCPGAKITPLEQEEGEDFEEKLTGKHLEAYSAFSKDWDIWKEATSGGLITNLLVEMLKDGRYDGAFVLPFDTFRGNPARLELVETEEEVLSAAKSKYIPASVYKVIEALEKNQNPNFVIVGIPCQIRGIKNYIDEKNIDDDDLLFLGLFCEKTLNFNVLRYFEDEFSRENEKIVKLDFRNKERDGWPGHVKIYFDSGRDLIVDRKERIKIKKYFQLERCLYCLDKLNRSADISVGDCYIRGQDEPGRSSVIVRTEKGKKVWKDYSSLFHYKKSSIESIKRSQSLSKKEENLEFLKALCAGESFLEGYSDEVLTEDVKNELSRRKKYIEWGRNYEPSKVKNSIFFSRLKRVFGIGKNILEGGLKVSTHVAKDILTPQSGSRELRKSGDNIIILGGELFNKGAQAMTFTVVDQMKRKFPEKKVYLFSGSEDFERDEREKEIYNFEIMPWGIGTQLNLLRPNIPLNRNKTTCLRDLREITENCCFFIDINGYALTSQFNTSQYWPSLGSYQYLLNIMIAKKLSIPFYIFPQSIGPFDYPLWEKFLLYPLMKKYLKYPLKIMPRENDGMKHLRKFTQNNIERKSDIVLLNGGYNSDNIFKKSFEPEKFDIYSDSVGIVPNSRVMERVKPKKIYSLYKLMINKILQSEKKVYIVRHSHEDFSICQNIKDFFPKKRDVKLISEDLNAIELEELMGQFNFVVASRYHSIVHAYKNGVPALAIGWAIKYYELLKDFHQLDYFFDVREGLEIDKLLKSLEKLIKKYEEEGEFIETKLGSMENNESFEILDI